MVKNVGKLGMIVKIGKIGKPSQFGLVKEGKSHTCGGCPIS